MSALERNRGIGKRNIQSSNKGKKTPIRIYQLVINQLYNEEKLTGMWIRGHTQD